MLDYDDDGSMTDGPNNIDILRMIPGATLTDYDMGGSPYLRRKIQLLMHEYRDIFSYNNVKGNTMLVTHMNFLVHTEKWKSNPNRLPSRLISVDKHDALN